MCYTNRAMPLTERDRLFLRTVDRFRIYLLAIGIAVLVYLLCTPPSELQMATSIIGIALCGVFWLTQRLLTLITLLDLELMKIVRVLQKTLPEEHRRELLS